MSKMQKRHFEAVERGVKRTLGSVRQLGNPTRLRDEMVLRSVASNLAEELRVFNPSFSGDKFMRECGF